MRALGLDPHQYADGTQLCLGLAADPTIAVAKLEEVQTEASA